MYIYVYRFLSKGMSNLYLKKHRIFVQKVTFEPMMDFKQKHYRSCKYYKSCYF